MTVYICPITSLQYTVSSGSSKEASMLWPHPSSKSRESILSLENKLKRLHGILVYYKIIEPIKDLSEVPTRTKLIASLSLTDNDIQILLFKLNTRKAPGINTNNSRELQAHLLKIITGDFSLTVAFKIDVSKETQSYNTQKRSVSQILNCLHGLVSKTKWNYLACPQNREHAKKLALSIKSNSDRANKVRALLIELSDNKAFSDERSSKLTSESDL